MSQAEIKTKLTADGSELSRAFDQGMTKAASFRTQVGNLGKTIGAAFTGAAVLGALRSWASQQEENIRTNKELRDATREFNQSIQDLEQRLGNAESLKAYGKVMLDFKQKVEDAKDAVASFSEAESVGGPAGFFKFLADAKESLVNGGEMTKGDRQLVLAIEQAGAAEKAYRAAKRERDRFLQGIEARTMKEERGKLAAMETKSADEAGREQFEKLLSNGSIQQIEAAQKALANYSEDFRKNLELGHGQAEGMAEKIHMSAEWAKEAAARLGELKDAAANAELGAGFFDGSAARGLLMGLAPEQRFSNLRRIGANELGSGVANRDNPGAIADKIIDKVGAKIAEGTAAFKDYGQKVLQGIGSFL